MYIEEEAFRYMKYICSFNLPEEKEYELRSKVTEYFENGEQDLLFENRLSRFQTDLSALRVLEVDKNVKKDLKHSIPKTVLMWFVVSQYYDQDKVILSYPDDQLAKDSKLVHAVLLAYQYHLIKIIWRKLDAMFPESHNRKEIIKKIDHGKEVMTVSKFILNQRKADLDKDHQSNLKILTEPADEYSEKVFKAWRTLPKFINNLYLNVLWDIHPKNGAKGEKIKWRRFKNSAQITFFAKNVFNLDEVRVTDGYKDVTLATSKPDSFTYPEQSCCDHH